MSGPKVRALGIFAKAPIPGRVKTRLADDVGPSAAAEIYWQIGLKVIAAVAGAGYRMVIWYTPAHEVAFMREWLDGVGRLELRPQASGSLGMRLAAAFSFHFAEGATRTVLIGSDCPGINRRLVAEAFNALAAYDVVLGPALDGGYYLVGLRAPQPVLFQNIPWSTGAVAVRTKARAQALGLSLYQLQPLRDVDTARDARAEGFLKP